MKKSISVPFFIRFEELQKKIQQEFGQDWEIVDIFKDKNGKWQIVIENVEQEREKIEERHRKALESLSILGMTRMLMKGDLLLEGKPGVPEEKEINIRAMITAAKSRNWKN